MEMISNILEAKKISRTNISEELTTDDICYFKYASFTFAVVERGFFNIQKYVSKLKKIFEHIKQYIIV